MDPNYGQNQNPENGQPQENPSVPQQPQVDAFASQQQQSSFEQHAPQYQPNPYDTNANYYTSANVQQVDPSKNGLAIASMILGIVSTAIGCCSFIAIISAIVGLILGIISIKSEKRGMAIAGIVLSSIGILTGICVAISMFVFCSDTFSTAFNELQREFGSGGYGAYHYFD